MYHDGFLFLSLLETSFQKKLLTLFSCSRNDIHLIDLTSKGPFDVVYILLIPLAASFQCIGLLFCTLLIQRKKKYTSCRHVFAVYLTSASRDSPTRTVNMLSRLAALHTVAAHPVRAAVKT